MHLLAVHGPVGQLVGAANLVHQAGGAAGVARATGVAGGVHPPDPHPVALAEARTVRGHRVHRSDGQEVVHDPPHHLGVLAGGHRLALPKALHHPLDVAGRYRALALQPPLGAPQPSLVVGGGQIFGGIHLLARRPSARSRAQSLAAHEHVNSEHPRLPALVVRILRTRLHDGPETVHPSHVVHTIHVAVSVFEMDVSEHAEQWLRTMVQIRLFEEKLAELYKAGRLVGVVHLSIGQEATAVGVCSALRDGDQITSTHRGHHHMLARGLDPRKMFAEILGRAGGYCGGKGGSMHVSAPGLGAMGANGIVGGGISHAVGLALAAQRLETQGVAVAFFGDGAANQGTLFESLNLAVLWRVPTLFVCENNGYTEFTPTDAITAGESIAARAAAFGIATEQVDGDDVFAVHRVAADAVARGRAGDGPTFIESRTNRWRGHHEGEESYASAYRDAPSPQDPIDRLERVLVDAAPDNAGIRAVIQEQERAAVEAALAAAQDEPEPPRERALQDVFA